MSSRRDFLQQGALGMAALSLPRDLLAPPVAPNMAKPRHARHSAAPRLPDAVAADVGEGTRLLTPASAGRWAGGGIEVSCAVVGDAVRLRLAAPGAAVFRIRLRWRDAVPGSSRMLGDAWERGYGDLEWRGVVPDRVMPWYVMIQDGETIRGHGVRTGARALCSWRVDRDGIQLVADVRSGGSGVELGDRTLDVCDIVTRDGQPGESAFAATHEFCRAMCPAPRLPPGPVFGTNDWYWAYGRNSAESARRDAHTIVSLVPDGAVRPFSVIDDGWQPGRGGETTGHGLWDRGNGNFPDMARLADDIHALGARPGIWIRPLEAPESAPAGWRLSRERASLDPTVPEVRQKVHEDIARLRRWGFELLKHDYTTYDLFGRWGFRMGQDLTDTGWAFAEGRGRTTAEVLNELYGTIRDAAGDALVIGCNTISHLSAGQFEMCRIGDDTSGTEWARTRRMGVNSLAFRAAQHGAFYMADPDCVGVTTQVPWAANRLWLDLVARSGTMLFVSLARDALTPEVQQDLRTALGQAADPQPLGEPLDWQESTWPAHWKLMNEVHRYEWTEPNWAP